MRYLYSFLFYLCLPFLFMRLVIRSFKLPAYRARMGERLGFYPMKFPYCIWVHAVSVGETLAAVPMVKALRKKYPSVPLLVTTMTPTGAERVKSAFGDDVQHAYIPYDTPDAMHRFYNTMRPLIGIIMETELWPNLIAIGHQKEIPLCLVNARLSEKSAKGYGKIKSLTRQMLNGLSAIAAHGQVDAERLLALGAPSDIISVTGNVKFDLHLPDDLLAKSSALRQQWGDRFTWIAASTHEGEEEIILAAHQSLRTVIPSALLILVPRHPDRFDNIAKLCSDTFPTRRRSKAESVESDTAIYLGDTMGELLLLYGAADVTFIGGSLIERGGHNMLEPAALDKPILTGPHLFNFAEISELFLRDGAMLKVHDAKTLADKLRQLWESPEKRQQMSTQARKVMSTNRGALRKQLQVVTHFIDNALRFI